MLRQFHFIDLNGKDQGINVRNRSKELTELLSDVERIRAERKKARTTKNKYGGVEGGLSMGGGGSRYGGFGNETGGFGGGSAEYGAYSGGVYGDGGGFGGNESGFSDSRARRDNFEEYDEYDEGAVAPPGRRQSDTRASAVKRETSTKKAAPPKPKEPEVDLFDFDEPAAPASTSNGKAPATSAAGDFSALQSGGGDDDDFDDFQSATPSTQAAPASNAFGIGPPASTSTTTASTQFAAPQPVQGAQKSNINDLFASVSPPPQGSTISTPMASSTFSPPPMSAGSASTPSMVASQPFKPAGYQPSGPNYFQSVPLGQSNTPGSSGTPGSVMSPAGSIGGQKPKPAGGDAFSSLLGGPKKSTPKPGSGVSMADMAKQKTSDSLWGKPAAPSAAPTAPAGQKPAGGSAFDDLLG